MSPPLMPIAVSARRVFILGLVAGYVDALSFVDLGGVFACGGFEKLCGFESLCVIPSLLH